MRQGAGDRRMAWRTAGRRYSCGSGLPSGGTTGGRAASGLAGLSETKGVAGATGSSSVWPATMRRT